MAAGHVHYRVAERTLDEVVSGVYPDDRQIGFALAKAQVHATLALAAATALGEDGRMPGADFDAWYTAAGVKHAAEPGRVWWLDDGHENPSKPPLFTTEPAARDAAIKRFESDNPFTDTGGVVAWLAQPEDGDSSDDAELVIHGRRTGIVVRPILPKAGA